MKRILLLLSFVALLVPLTALSAHAAPPKQSANDWPIPGGHFYTQTAHEGYGFSVVDDDEADFWSEFNRLGGLENVGYPISRRFEYDGFVVQAFQKLVLQWRPEVGEAWPMNVFDELSYEGFDDVLFTDFQTPYHLTDFDPPGASWNQIICNRRALLDANPAIRARYFSVLDPLTVFGLPVSRVEDMGNHYAIRTQRAVFQQWKVAVPWAAAGQVTIANGGDIGKELGWLSGAALEPEPIPGGGGEEGGYVSQLLVGGGTPQRLYALVTTPSSTVILRLSTDGGTTWQTFGGQVPPGMHAAAVVPGDPDIVTVLASDGIYRWQNSAWNKISTQIGQTIATGFSDPNVLYVSRGAGQGEFTDIHRSSDGGATWTIAAPGFAADPLSTVIALVVDPRDDATLFATAVNRYGSGIFNRHLAGESTWSQPPMPGLSGLGALALDSSAGVLYASGTYLNASIYRSDNPTAPAPQVSWSPVAGGEGLFYQLLAVGHEDSTTVLYANVAQEVNTLGQLHRSTDGGATWEPLTQP